MRGSRGRARATRSAYSAVTLLGQEQPLAQPRLLLVVPHTPVSCLGNKAAVRRCRGRARITVLYAGIKFGCSHRLIISALSRLKVRAGRHMLPFID